MKQLIVQMGMVMERLDDDELDSLTFTSQIDGPWKAVTKQMEFKLFQHLEAGKRGLSGSRFVSVSSDKARVANHGLQVSVIARADNTAFFPPPKEPLQCEMQPARLHMEKFGARRIGAR